MRRIVLLSFVALAVLVPVDSSPSAAAEAVVVAGGIRFEPATAGERWRLTVSGPDGYFQRLEFDDGEPLLSLSEGPGETLADGSYTWELRPLGEHAPDRGSVRSGSFRVEAGAARLPDASVEERALSPETSAGGSLTDAGGAIDPSPAVLDHAGDFYIGPDIMGLGGGLAFGNDIDGTETLAFISMLVKENNLHLKFEDSSTAAEFATVDWQITMNDSSLGGLDYFRIEELDAATQPFRIDGGAATDSLRIDQNGRVGIGTATPGALLHVDGDAMIEGDFSVLSSRAAKEGLAAVDPRAVLAALEALPVLEWSYLGSETRHLGPVAEDFYAAFRLGRGERTVNPLDLAGVALAAIQGLRSEVAALAERNAANVALLGRRASEIADLERDRDALLERVGALEKAIAALTWDATTPRAGSR